MKPLSPALGVEVLGVDLRRELDPRTIEEIRDAWNEHLVLLFRDQELSEDDQVRFALHFGLPQERNRPLSQRNEAGRTKHPGIMLVSNIREDGKLIGSLPDGEMQFHSDGCYIEVPIGGTFLYAIEVPSAGGDTLFANMEAAYNELPAKIKAEVEGRNAINAYHYGTTDHTALGDDWRNHKHFSHPIVRIHPATGRKALYINRLMTWCIEDMEPEESRKLLAYLFDHIEQPRFVHAHKWRVGDLVIWDNRNTLHARTDFSDKERRLLRRCTTRGEKVLGAPRPAEATLAGA